MALQIVESQNCQSLKLKGWPATAAWTLQQVRDHMQSLPYIAWTDNQQVAALILYRDISSIIEVNFLLTLPEFRRLGLMESLFEILIEKKSLCTFWLEVNANNQGAHQLYVKLGFKNNGLRKNYYRDGGDGLLLERPPNTLGAS